MNRTFLVSFLLITLVACASNTSNQGTANENSYATIVISNGKSQCINNALPITTTKRYLLDAGIAVKSQSCGMLNGMMYASVCGGRTGQVHIFIIERDDLNKAKALGFKALTDSMSEVTKVECDVFIDQKTPKKHFN